MASSINLHAQHIKQGDCGSPNNKECWNQPKRADRYPLISIGHEQRCLDRMNVRFAPKD